MDDYQDAAGGRAQAGRKTEAASTLVWGVARNLTSALESGRGAIGSALGTALEEVSSRVGRLVGTLRDVGDDLSAYVDPTNWLEDLYVRVGIATSGSLTDMDERMDSVEFKVDDVARKRAREELLLLQQRIGELEDLLGDIHHGEARTAMESVLLRLTELETRIESLPATAPERQLRSLR